jgi:hypothetical protein
MKLVPFGFYSLELLLLIVVIWMNVGGIASLFGYPTAAVIGVLVMLEGFFFRYYHAGYAGKKAACLASLKPWAGRFYAAFLMLTLCNVATFAARDLALAVPAVGIRMVFWVLFAGLFLIGARLAWCILAGGNDDGDGSHGKPDATVNSPTAARYGMAGYGVKS